MVHRFGPPLCLMILLSTFGTAAADPSSGRARSTPAADAATVADHVRRADRARLLGRWADAAAAYAEALAAAVQAGLPENKRAVIVGELGAAEAVLERYRDAAEHLHWSLTYDAALTAEQKARYRKARDKAVAEVAILIVAVDPSDAELLVDGKPLPERRSSHILFLEPGQHTFRARLSGFVDGTARQDTPKGTKATLGLELVQLAPAPTPAPLAPRPVTATVAPDNDGARFRTPVFILAGSAALLGGALLGAAIAVDDGIEDRTADLGSRAGSYACSEGAYKAECTALEAQIGNRDTLARVGWGALAVGAGLGAVGLGSLLFGSEDKSSTRVGVVPGGVLVRGEL